MAGGIWITLEVAFVIWERPRGLMLLWLCFFPVPFPPRLLDSDVNGLVRNFDLYRLMKNGVGRKDRRSAVWFSLTGRSPIYILHSGHCYETSCGQEREE